jgi:hypothetical protein
MEPGRFRRHKGTRIHNPHQLLYRNRIEGKSNSPWMKEKKAPELLPCPFPSKEKTPGIKAEIGDPKVRLENLAIQLIRIQRLHRMGGIGIGAELQKQPPLPGYHTHPSFAIRERTPLKGESGKGSFELIEERTGIIIGSRDDEPMIGEDLHLIGREKDPQKVSLRCGRRKRSGLLLPVLERTQGTMMPICDVKAVKLRKDLLEPLIDGRGQDPEGMVSSRRILNLKKGKKTGGGIEEKSMQGILRGMDEIGRTAVCPESLEVIQSIRYLIGSRFLVGKDAPFFPPSQRYLRYYPELDPGPRPDPIKVKGRFRMIKKLPFRNPLFEASPALTRGRCLKGIGAGDRQERVGVFF